jgi:hypothetical protein
VLKQRTCFKAETKIISVNIRTVYTTFLWPTRTLLKTHQFPWETLMLCLKHAPSYFFLVTDTSFTYHGDGAFVKPCCVWHRVFKHSTSCFHRLSRRVLRSYTFWVYVSVVRDMQRVTRMRCIVLSPAVSLAPPYFSTLSHKRHKNRKNFTEHKRCVLIFSTTFT